MEVNFEEQYEIEEYEKRRFEIIKESFPYPLPKDEQNELLIKMKDGDKEARNILIERNLRLVASVAIKYVGMGLPLDDLIQEGSIGLMKALDAFEPERGYQLSTYAKPKIEREILVAVKMQTNLVHIPRHIVDQISSYNKMKQEEMQKSGRNLTLLELSERLNMDIEKIKYLEIAQKQVRSLYEICGENDNMEVIEFIAIDTPSVEEIIIKEELTKKINQLLAKSNLTPKQKIVIIYRMGLNGNNILTQSEIGELLNVKHQRVGELEKKAIEKLIEAKGTEHFHIYMDHPEKAREYIRKKKYQQS